MRILHIANFSNNKFGAEFYAIDRKISAGLIRNGHFVYDFSYRDICRNATIFRTTKLGGAKVNEHVLTVCDRINPHLVLLGHSELITSETLHEIKKRRPHVKIGIWYVDPLFYPDQLQHIVNRLDHLDVLFATTGGELLQQLSTKTTKSAFIPNPVDPAVETQRAFEQKEYEYDLIFCGRDSTEPDRQQFMRDLMEDSSRFLRCNFKGCLGNPLISGSDYLDYLGKAKMGLNNSRRNDIFLYSSDRLMQLTGNGLLTFCPRIPGMESLYSSDELVYFEDFNELVDKVKYYNTHDEERITIAQNGYNKAHTSFNTQKICSFMIEVLFQLPFSIDYEWSEHIFLDKTPLEKPR